MTMIKKFYEYNIKEVDIKEVIKNISTKYTRKYNTDLIGLNSGYCEDIAYDILKYLDDSTSFIMDDGWFWSIDEISNFTTSSGEYWNIDNLNKYGIPPFELDMANDLTGHVWIFHNGLHYDVEETSGVLNFFDLPIYKRQYKLK